MNCRHCGKPRDMTGPGGCCEACYTTVQVKFIDFPCGFDVCPHKVDERFRVPVRP